MRIIKNDYLCVKLPEDLVREDIPSWIMYIHQLQNWYFMENKCQKELTFK